MTEQFIGEPIEPVAGTMDAGRMARGEPGIARQFRWRSDVVTVARVLRAWRETGPCRHGSGERYARKHWFEVATDSGTTMTIYFERTARLAKTPKNRWWLFSIEEATE
ncbi:MAG: hypothetical protein JW719_09535 [Pirellulales bacterium]|nr:hypothetical protein [Pirellulales bacterium]